MKLWEKGNLKNIESRNVLIPEIVTPRGKRLQKTTQTLSALVCLPEEGPHSACSRAKWEGPETALPSSPGLEASPLSKLHSRLDSLLVTQWTPRHTRRDSRGEQSFFLPLEARPDSSGVKKNPLLRHITNY